MNCEHPCGACRAAVIVAALALGLTLLPIFVKLAW